MMNTLPLIARLARTLGLPLLLQKGAHVKVRQRGSSDAQNLLGLIFALCTGGGHLNAVDALAADEAACTGTGLQGAAVGYNGERQYWLHAVLVGRAWVSARLNEGGTDVKGDFAEQLAADVDKLDLGDCPVWARADAAYCCKDFVTACTERGWDYSVSVTDPNKKAPVLRLVEGEKLEAADWGLLDERGGKRAVTVQYQPSQWAKEQTYLVIRRDRDGQQELLQPVYTVILVSRDDLGLGELVRRHHAKQGQENALKGPLTELGLHHPPCHSYKANQAFYWCGQIARLLLLALQHQVLPEKARQHGLWPLIRWHFVCSAGRLCKSGRRLTMMFARCNYRLDWLLRAEHVESG